MANTLKGNVWVVDTDGAFGNTGYFKIVGVALEGGSDTTSIILKVDGTSGTQVYKDGVAANGYNFNNVYIVGTALAADITGTGAKAYIYFA